MQGIQITSTTQHESWYDSCGLKRGNQKLFLHIWSEYYELNHHQPSGMNNLEYVETIHS